MRRIWNALRAWLAGLRTSPRQPETPPPSAEAMIRPGLRDTQATEDYSFYFREQILDRIDDYFQIVSTMHRHDREAFDLFSKVGGTLLPAYRWIKGPDVKPLSPWWTKNRPTFGCIAWGAGSDFEEVQKTEKTLIPRLFYFNKFAPHKLPPDYQRMARGIDVYVCAVYWYKKGRLAAPAYFAVAIDKAGGLTVLRAKMVHYEHKTIKRGRDRGTGFKIPYSTWGIPEFFHEWAAEHGQTAENWLKRMFVNGAHDFERTQGAMVRVAVTRADSNLVVSFGIDPRRAAYFFKDRDSISGKRIFHIVRAHERTRGNNVSPVRLHFRGERHFMWNGYTVDITVPGLHHQMMAEFDVAMLSETDDDKADLKKTVGMAEMGEMWRDHMLGKNPNFERTQRS